MLKGMHYLVEISVSPMLGCFGRSRKSFMLWISSNES